MKRSGQSENTSLPNQSPRVLYIVYWGAGEVTGKSWILPHVKSLAARGAKLTLVTFEKPADLARADEIAEIERTLKSASIEWIPLRYHKSPKIPATAFDVLHGVARGAAANMRGRFDIIHARTFIGGLIGHALTSVIRAKLIYHNEGFYPDEQVDAGVWAAESLPHRVAKSLEEKMYARADAIIAMSHCGKKIIENLPAVRCKRTPVIAIPAAVNLEHFRWDDPSLFRAQAGDVIYFIYIGSVGGRYMLDAVGRFVAVASQEIGSAYLRVLTKADCESVASVLSRTDLPNDAWSVDSVPHMAIPDELAAQHVGLFFLSQGLSEHGCSPTKIGEYWAAGLPVVTTPNVGDTEEIIRRERVGVIVSEHSDAAYSRAVHDLRTLLLDADLPSRCRRVAETHYALQPAIERQFKLYQDILSRP